MALRTNQHPPNTDVQLWNQLKSGNELAFGKLLAKYFNPLQNYGYKFVQNEDFVKDCVQEVFIEIWNRRDRISTPDSVRAYLLSCVRKRVVREGYRQRVLKDDEPANLENEGSFVEFSPEWSMIEQESLAETTHRIANALNKLPKRQREVIYLRFYQNLERDEIAVIMDVNPQSVSNLMQVAFKTFREHWAGVLILIGLIGRLFSNL
ncbi:RNA polymerase sigma factor [Fibrivirga algicola]|uniref:Sigma-70 family RNA polymerase sigma factor n=1 Tax=Fibrivirga algicola TaxID=2950420 RepID=A0ABX0QIE1_9BACT|nr:sigma-70 family RNA polymerase sigma factor [Fibrivirga algicola]NID12019.1 sigma-70 family RNA polymerase sigma factor [Fibrivirga algicola]